MSFQAGMIYFDDRPIAENEADAIRGWVQSDDCEPATSHRHDGVFLAHSASRCSDRLRGQSQPCFGPSCALTLDGRLDNRPDLLLRWRGALHADTSDAALAMAAYETSGADSLGSLVGDWSLALWDSRRRTVLLASDFAGARPLYYCVQPNRVFWSTRLRPLAEWAQPGEFDDAYIAGMLAFEGCPNRTPYCGIYSVPPGQAVMVTAGGVRIRRFWDPPVADVIRYSRESEYEEHLRSLFREAVRCRLPAGAPCLSELSGGFDSSSMVCMAAEVMRAGEAPTERFVTLSVEHEGSVDQPFYTAVEQLCGFESIHLSAADHPFLTQADPGGALPAFWEPLEKWTAAIARQIGATTYWTGRPGDIVMGNSWDASGPVAGLLRRARFGRALREAFAWSKTLRLPLGSVLWKAFLASVPPSLGPARWCRSSAWSDPVPDGEDSITPAFRKRVGVSEETFFSQAWIQAPPERRKHFRDLMRILELRRLQPPEPLEHLEYTHPYAHRPLVTFLCSIPADILWRPGEPRRLMHRALGPLWPPKLRKRRSKDDFSGVFLDSVRPLGSQLLKPGQLLQVVERGYVDRASLQKRLQRLSLSLSCNESQLRKIILLEFWLRAWEARLHSEPICCSV